MNSLSELSSDEDAIFWPSIWVRVVWLASLNLEMINEIGTMVEEYILLFCFLISAGGEGGDSGEYTVTIFFAALKFQV